MAQLPGDSGGIPSVSPDPRPPSDYQSIQTSPDMFGASIAQGLSKVGEGVTAASQFYGQVAADDGANGYIDDVNRVLHGDPNKKIKGPDGAEMPDPGYMGLTGANAMRAYPDVAKQLKELREQRREGMPTAEAKLRFDNITRPEYARRLAMAGTKSDSEFKTYGKTVNETTLNQSVNRAFTNWNNPEELAHAKADILHARANIALMQGARPGDPLYQAAIEQGERDTLRAVVNGMAVHDPVGAMNLLKRSEKLAGAEYPAMEAALRPKKEEAVGEGKAAQAITRNNLAPAIVATANKVGISAHDLATAISYETGGTFDPWKAGPTTQWGQHRGLIQWGEPQRAKYGVTKDMPVMAQMDAVARYLVDAGVKPGDGLLQVYAAINAGDARKVNASDANNGGAPGTVADKVNNQMSGHAAKAAALLSGMQIPQGQYAPAAGRAMAMPPGAAGALPKTADFLAPQAAPSYSSPPPLAPSKIEARQQIMDDPDLNYRERAIALSRVDQHYQAMTAEQNSLVAAAKASIQSATETGKPVPGLEPRITTAMGPQAAAKYVTDLGIAQTYHTQTKDWLSQSNEDIDESLKSMDPAIHHAGDENYPKYKEFHDKAREKADKIRTQRATDPAASVGDQPTVQAAGKGASLDKHESYQPLIEARMLAQQNVGIPEDNRMPLTRAEAKALWEPIKLSSETDRPDMIGATLRQLDAMTGGDRDRADRAFQQIQAWGGADKKTRDIGANLWRKLTSNLPITREEADVFDIANRTAMATQAGSMLGVPTVQYLATRSVDAMGVKSPKELIVQYYHAAGQDIPPDVVKQYGITPDDAKMKPMPYGKPLPPGGQREYSPNTDARTRQALVDRRDSPDAARYAAQYDAIYGAGAAAKVFASLPARSEDAAIIINRRNRLAATKEQVNEQLRAIGEGREPNVVPLPTAPITLPSRRPEVAVSDEQRRTAQALRGDVVEAQTPSPERIAEHDAELQRQIRVDLEDKLKGIETRRKVAQRMAEGPMKAAELDNLKRQESWLKEQIKGSSEGGR